MAHSEMTEGVVAADDDSVLVDDRGAVRVLTMNRPRRRNALDLVLRVALAEAIETAMADDAVRAIVLTGADQTFCSGGDLSTMQRQPAEQARARLRMAERVVRAICDGPKPVVAAVEGAAYGAGVALAIACDRVVTASNASLSTAFTRVGLAGDLGVFYSLPRRVGPARAAQMLMLPAAMSGTEALEIGLVDMVTEPGGALAAAERDAARLAAGPPLALGAIKAMFRDADLHAVLGREVDAQAALFDTADFAEGLAAFRERRDPEFRGR